MHLCFSIGATAAPLMLGIATQESADKSHAHAVSNNTTADANELPNGASGFTLIYGGLSLGFIIAVVLLLAITSPARPQAACIPIPVPETDEPGDISVAAEQTEVQMEDTELLANPIDDSNVRTTKASPASAVAMDDVCVVPALPAKTTWTLTFAAAAILFCYAGAEISFVTYITSYAVLELRMPESDAQYLAAVYWGALTAGRGFSIFLSVLVRPQLLLMASIGLSASIGLAFAVLPKSGSGVWLITVCFGLCMAPQFSSCFTFVNNITALSAKHATVCSVCVGLGGWLLPFLVAVSMGNTNTAEGIGSAFPIAFTGIIAGAGCCNMLLILWMAWYVARHAGMAR
jgi:hypothetical protein